MPLINDILTISAPSGTITARIKNYYKQNGVMVIYDVYPYESQSNIVSGLTVTTQDSAETIVLNNSNFIVDWEPYQDNYDASVFDINTSSVLVCNGGYVATDAHFTGKEQTQDYQYDNLIVEDYSKQTNDGWEG